ncbi:MAG: ABC transporter substrate-binding protein [Acetobacteraceae bacterium]
MLLTRRKFVQWAGAGPVIAAAPLGQSQAASKVVRIGVEVALTGAGADSAIRIRNAVILAIGEANQAGNLGGYTVEPLVLDDGTSQYRSVRPGAGCSQCPENLPPYLVVGAIGPENSGVRQGAGADLEPGRHCHHHARLHQP